MTIKNKEIIRKANEGFAADDIETILSLQMMFAAGVSKTTIKDLMNRSLY